MVTTLKVLTCGRYLAVDNHESNLLNDSFVDGEQLFGLGKNKYRPQFIFLVVNP